jgi:hypothetical protein
MVVEIGQNPGHYLPLGAEPLLWNCKRYTSAKFLGMAIS